MMLGLMIGGAALVLIGLLIVFLPMTDPFGLYADGEEKGGASGGDIPASAQNVGGSPGDLAAAHMPGGFELYAGVSLDGLLDAALFTEAELKIFKKELASNSGPLKRLFKKADVSIGDISTLVAGYGERGGYGAMQFGGDVDIEEVDGVLADVKDISVKNWGEVEQVYVNARAEMAAFTQDDGVLVMGMDKTVKNVLDGDDDEYPGNFMQVEGIESLTAHLNLGGVAWVMLAPDEGVAAFNELPKDEIPGPVNAMAMDGLMAAGLSVHLNEDIYVQLALVYEDADRAEEVFESLADMKEEQLGEKGVLQMALDESEEGSSDEDEIQIVYAHLHASELNVSGEVVTFSTRLRTDLIEAYRKTIESFLN